MANCPNCGSNDIQIKTDSRQNVNWGRAIAGWALFGVVGGAVGAVTGKGRSETITANVCLNCGTIWDAATLYKLLKHIEFITGTKLDLSLDKDRDRMDIFISDIQPLINKQKQLNTYVPALPPSKALSWLKKICSVIFGFLALGFSIRTVFLIIKEGYIYGAFISFLLGVGSFMMAPLGLLFILLGFSNIKFNPQPQKDLQASNQLLIDEAITEFNNRG